MFVLRFIADIICFSIIVFVLYLCKNKFIEHFQDVDSENWMPSEQMKEFKQLVYLIIAGFENKYLYC